MESDLSDFGRGLASLNLRETDMAVALIWFLERRGEQETSARQLAELIHDLALKGRVNVSRLATRLSAHKATVRGKTAGTFRLRLAQKPALDERFGALTAPIPPTIESHLIDRNLVSGTRGYLIAIVNEINGCYQLSFYNGCAVMCRRLMETLLIEAFEQAGKGQAIRDAANDYVGLSDIIKAAKSGQHLRLARGTGAVLDQVKNTGHAAAHSRTHITSKQDIDDLKGSFRRVVSELLHLANLQPKT